MARHKGVGYYWGPVLCWAALIFVLSSMSQFPRLADNLLSFDKLWHVLVYGVLGFLLLRALAVSRQPGIRRYAAVLAVVLGVLYGVSDEWHQSFIANRTASGVDVIFDGFGALLGQWVRQKFWSR